MRRLALALCVTLIPLAASAQEASPVGEPLTLKALLERGEGDVRARLGEPDVARREDGGAMWTYRLPGCALYVFFRTAGREGLRVVGASTGPRRQGEVAPEVDACLAVTGTV
jgi:hypothetical protein